MANQTNTNRRNFLKIGASAVGAFWIANPITKSLAASCGLTPPQTPGPFYPGEKQFHVDNDLTYVAGHSKRALGQVIFITGKVLDTNCNPVKQAKVEIWQACESGRYNNHTDTNPAPLDPNFKYWGETLTDANGNYQFKTIIPGAYPADPTWTRPPHIHFHVSKLGFHELITQMYFSGDALNATDQILQALSPSDRQQVIVNFQAAPLGFEAGSLLGNFDITLVPVARR